VNMTEILLTSH